MGLFCANFHFRTTDDNALSASVNRRGVTRYRIAPAKDGWASLYEEQASQQDEGRIRELAGGLSADLHAAVIAFLVHDSDVACYWLFDDGRLLDEYNSCPDYFDEDGPDDGPPSRSGGRPEVLLRYCRTGVRQEELAAILAEETVFAENVILQLAAALGIDRERALADYRDDAGAPAHGADGANDDGDDVEAGRVQNISPRAADVARQLTGMFSPDPRNAPADPRVQALVEAAAADDTDGIKRLLSEGVAIDAVAPCSLAGGQAMAGMGHLFPGGAPKVAMTPLLAAIVNRRRRAAERLLDEGADPNRAHPLFGTSLHVATGAGDAELLRLLIDRGGDVNVRNARGQTPLQVVVAARATRDRLAQAQAMIKSMGIKAPGMFDQMSNVALPTEGWDACERLLKAQAAS
jgi:hypothetical protein